MHWRVKAAPPRRKANMLTLEVEFLTGVCYAARSQASELPDWPPQPDRLFSALVAAWGTRGEQPAERAALEWLERQPAPAICATKADHRRIGIAYVPPNDVGDKVEALPDRRKRQPRMFPAAVPAEPVISFAWVTQPDPATLQSLQALARDTAYLGHSSSLVRCAFAIGAGQNGTSQPSQRSIYPGRLEYLEREYRAHRRPQLGELVTGGAPAGTVAEGSRSLFSGRFITFEDDGGDFQPDLRAFPLVAKRTRDALMKLHGDPIPEWLSGHLPGGSPTSTPHLAIIPLADVGFDRSEGRLLGFALVLPAARQHERETALTKWLDGLAPTNPWSAFTSALVALQHLKLGERGVWAVTQSEYPSRRSLQARRYTKASRRWASVTPVALDRYPKAKGEAWDAEVQAIIRQSCENIGLPAPARVRVAKHSSVQGAPSAAPSGNAPAWTGWTLAGALTNRVLLHVDLEFAEPVAGPVLLGAGRFLGLGLCLAMDGDREQHKGVEA